MTVIELIAGLIFIKGFKTALWDYSKMKGNIMGIICPQYSLIWLGASALYILAHSLFRMYVGAVISNPLTIFPLGFLSGAFVVDFGYSAHVLIRIRSFINDRKQTIDWDQIKINLKNSRDKVKDSLFKVFFWPFSIDKKSAESGISRYISNIKKRPKGGDIEGISREN